MVIEMKISFNIESTAKGRSEWEVTYVALVVEKDLNSIRGRYKKHEHKWDIFCVLAPPGDAST